MGTARPAANRRSSTETRTLNPAFAHPKRTGYEPPSLTPTPIEMGEGGKKSTRYPTGSKIVARGECSHGWPRVFVNRCAAGSRCLTFARPWEA